MAIFAHTSIHIRDIDKSVAFYSEALGLEKLFEMPMPGAKLTFLGSPEGGAQLELTWLEEQGDKPYDIGEEEVIHLGFTVSNFEETKAKHEKMGVIVFNPDYMPPYFIADPDGYWVEIIPGQ
ncbi:MAG: VOC family protein [Oscillospiraceae bacterium]|jgi:lactoylglutathione lyase|nr:VOC family protein [Oscillospiraceae bacterium]